MKRDTALALLVSRECSQEAATREAARLTGLSQRTVLRWPRQGHLPRAMADRVLAALVRKRIEQAQRAGLEVSPIEVDAVMLPELPQGQGNGQVRNA